MSFTEWMRNKGLSESSILKYDNAISGTLSQWAIEAGIISEDISTISDKNEFDHLAAKIRNLDIFLERNVRGNGMYGAALMRYSEYLSNSDDKDVVIDIEKIVSDRTLDITEMKRLVKSRLGQGIFREKLISYWGGCAVTHVKDTRLLIASHIKPWRNSSNSERLDVHNGLLLLPNFDLAFDAGLISFDKMGAIMISPQLEEPQKLGIYADLKIKLSPDHEKYFEHHRVSVFRV